MAKREKKEEKRRVEATKARTEIVPARPGPLASLAERMEELFGEPPGLGWPVRWPALRWPELRWPEPMAALPVLDVFEEGDTVVVKAEVPGLAREDIDVRIAGDVLTLSGKKEKEEKIDRRDYFRYERSAGSFSRSVRLPAEVEVEKVTAKLDGGVLEIRAPKSEAAKAKTRKITVG